MTLRRRVLAAGAGVLAAITLVVVVFAATMSGGASQRVPLLPSPKAQTPPSAAQTGAVPTPSCSLPFPSLDPGLAAVGEAEQNKFAQVACDLNK